jgi:hypothetical protein
MNSRRFGAVLAVAIALGLLGQAGAQDEASKAKDTAGQAAEKDAAGQTGAKDSAGQAAEKDAAGQTGAKDSAGQPGAKDTAGQVSEDTAAQAAIVCKNPQCPGVVGAWLLDMKACEVKTARIKELDEELVSLKGKGKDAAELQSRLDTCATASAETEKRAKEATELADALKKELEQLKAVIAGTDAEKLKQALDRAIQWKTWAERKEAESETARKDAEAAKKDAEVAKKEADEIKVEAEAAKKEATELKMKVATLELLKDDPNRGVKRIDQTPDDTKASDTATKTPEGETKADASTLSELELKNKKLQEILEDTRRVLVEEKKEKEVSEGAIRQVLADLVDHLGKTFECASFSVEMRNGARVLKGSVAESRHRDEAWKLVLDSPLARLVHSSEIDVTASGGRVCLVKTREPGWLMARSREKADEGFTLFLRLSLDSSLIQMLPRASDHSECERLGAVIKALEPLEPRPSELAVWVRGGNDAVTQCYASPEGWKLRYRVPERDGKWLAWILVPEGSSVRP